jgi:tetratricopeptide (TPR) repeat protein
LYEAYIARGEAASAAGDYFTALNDYQQSAVLALESPDSLLRLFEAQLKIAETKGRLGDYEDAVRVYQAALEQINFDFRASQDNPTIARGLDSAANLANANNFRQAYLRYRETLANARDLFEYFTYEVQPGDYLASIARRFNTTLEALADANSIDNPNKILDLDKLVIPSLPPTEPEPTTEP